MKKRKLSKTAKRAIRSLILCFLVAAAGVAVAIMGIRMGGGGFRGLVPMQEFYPDEYTSLKYYDQYSKVIIDDKFGDIEVTVSPDDYIHIFCHKNGDESFEITEKQGVLRARYVRHAGQLDFNLNLTRPDTRVTLQIPADYSGNLSLETDSGDVILSGLEKPGEVIINARGGRAVLEGFAQKVTVSAESHIDLISFKAGEMELTTRRGTVFGSFEAETAKISTLHGSVDLSEARGTLTLMVGAKGTLTVELYEGPSLHCQTEAGDMNIGLSTLENWKVLASTGGVLSVPASSGKNELILTSETGNITAGILPKEANE